MPVDLLLPVAAVFVLVGLSAASGTWWWLSARTPEQRRLRTLGGTKGSVLGETAQLVDTDHTTFARVSRWLPKSPKEMSRVQLMLTRAGYMQFRAVAYYSIAEVALPILFAGVVLVVFGVTGGLLYALAAAALGYVTPGLYIGRKTRLRQKAIRNGLPDALDLLTVCVEAGSGLDQALQKASSELGITHPELADELRLITIEIRAGKARLDAFKNFAKRTGVEEVRSLVSMLTQTDRFGTSIAQALRVQSEVSRTKRRQAAEERAGKVGVKLVFPLALCLFPALYVVCFGPVVVKVYRAFFTGDI